MLERADDVGGVWHYNTYPGCTCDVPSHLYSFSFAPNPEWTHTYSPQPEIQRLPAAGAPTGSASGRTCGSGSTVDGAEWDEDDAAMGARRPAPGRITAEVLSSAPWGR